MKRDAVSNIGDELVDAELGNAARSRRLAHIAGRMAAQPEASLPKQMPNSAELEAAYRLLENEAVDPQAVLDAHIAKTVERANKLGEILVLHDTTEFRFSGKQTREGLGYLNGKRQQGFYAHFSMAVGRDGQPLGTLHGYAWKRPVKPAPVSDGQLRRRTHPYDPDRESLRWGESALACAERIGTETSLIHVMDREGDCLEHFALLLEHEQRFVIRLAHDRRLSTGRIAEEDKLFGRLAGAPQMLQREVVLSQRGESKADKAKKKFPARERRSATLAIRAQQLQLFSANGASANVPKSMTLNFVDVEETNPPEDCVPVRWRLITTESIDTNEQVAAIVDIYLKRWLIEEFFKGIKTGCRYEERQFKTAHALLIDLAIESVIAWRLIRMRWFSRVCPDEQASRVLTQSELAALGVLCATRGYPLAPNATVAEVLTAVALLGGYIKRRDPPGWLVMRRGFSELAIAERMWLAMNRSAKVIDD